MRDTWSGYIRSHLVGWSVVTGLVIGAAGWTGHTAARAKLDTSREQMVVSYLGELDPRVMARLRP